MVNFKEKVELLSEDFDVIESKDNDGNLQGVVIEGLAITFEKPTRNRVSYTYESGTRTHKSLVGKPFLDSHIDKSIHKNPPFGHVIETWMGKNPKNGLPALYYKVDVDPTETKFIRKLKRKDIPGVSVQVLVDSVTEKEDMYGDYIQANIREFLELSAVLIPGDGDTTMRLVESFNNFKSTFSEDVDTSNGNAVFNADGVLPKRKIIKKDPETEEGCGNTTTKSKIYEPNPEVDESDEDDMVDGSNSNKRLQGKKMEENSNKTSDNSYEERFSKIESMLDKMSKTMEGLAEGQPEDDKKGKLSGKEKDPENVNQDGVGMKSIESMIRQVLKEELTGAPERKKGHEQKDIGPKNTDGLPHTQQPENGDAPGEMDTYNLDNKRGEEQAEDAQKKANMPKSDYNKPAIKKNSLDDARTLIEKAKEIMKEYAKGDDVYAPQPGRTEDDAKDMEETKPNTKKGSGFEEGMKEMDDKDKEDDEDDYDKDMKKMYESLKSEIKSESKSKKSIVGVPIQNSAKTIKESVNDYLTKSNLYRIIYNK